MEEELWGILAVVIAVLYALSPAHTHDALFLALVLLLIQDHSEPVQEVNLVFKELASIKTERQ